jgi:hypothetical protein
VPPPRRAEELRIRPAADRRRSASIGGGNGAARDGHRHRREEGAHRTREWKGQACL